MKTVAVYNRKGGTGKTTCTLNLAHELDRTGLCVLLVDLDGQCDLTTQCQQKPGKPGGRQGNDILAVLKGQKTAADVAVRLNGTQNLHLIPGHTKIESFDFQHSQKILLDSFQQPGLEEVDLVLIDFPSAENLAVTCGLMASDYVLFVTEPEKLSMDNLERGFATISEVNQQMKHLTVEKTVEPLGILVNKVDQRRGITQKNLDTLEKRYQDLLLPTIISVNTGIVNSLQLETTVRKLPFRPVTVSQFTQASVEVVNRLRAKGVTFFDDTETETAEDQ